MSCSHIHTAVVVVVVVAVVVVVVVVWDGGDAVLRLMCTAALEAVEDIKNRKPINNVVA